MSPQARVAVVTGGAGNTGATCARRLAADGAAVVVCDANGEPAQAVAGSIVSSGGGAIASMQTTRRPKRV